MERTTPDWSEGGRASATDAPSIDELVRGLRLAPTPLSLFAIDDGRFLAFPRLSRLLPALHGDEARGRAPEEFMPPAAAALFRAAARRLEDRLGEVDEREVELSTARGFACWSVCSRIVVPKAGAAALLSIWTDVSDRREAFDRLRESRAFLRGLIANLPIGVLATDLESRCVLFANPTLATLFGRDSSAVLGRSIYDFADRAFADAMDEGDDRIAASEGGADAVVETFERAIGPPESARALRVTKAAVRDEGGKPSQVLSLLEDVTEARALFAALERQRDELERSQAIALLGTWRLDRDGALRWSPQLPRLLGLAPEPGGDGFARMAKRFAGERFARAVDALWRDGQPFTLELEGVAPRRRKRGAPARVFRLQAEAERDETGAIVAVAGVCQDITVEMAARDKIRHLACFDTLTELPNRHSFIDQLQNAIDQAGRRGERFAVHCVNLNDFKGVNDTLGHVAGDELLRQTASRLRSKARSEDAVARIGGDEFALIQTPLSDKADASELARRLLEELAKPNLLASSEVVVSASAGFGVFPDDGETPQDVLRAAGAALREARRAGRGRQRAFTTAMTKALSRRKLIENEMRVALAEGGFHLHYQPQYTLADHKLIGFEALMRWRHEELGSIAPNEFIAVAEASGQILELGAFAIRDVARRATAWSRKFDRQIKIAVNLSPAQFAYQDLTATVARILGEENTAPEAIELELTESALMRDTEAACDVLQELRQLGVGIALDDFGTGYSSLAYLKRFPLDKLKIDRSFVDDLPHDSEAVGIVRTIISLANMLDLRCVAEGVERGEQESFLFGLGCEEAQGFGYSPPLAPEAAEDFIRAATEGDAEEAPPRWPISHELAWAPDPERAD